MTAASVELDDLYENAWHSVAKPPRRRSGIIREMSLSMRAPSVAPRGADVVGSLKVCRGGTTVGETREEGGNYNFRVHALHSCREITKSLCQSYSLNSAFFNLRKYCST